MEKDNSNRIDSREDSDSHLSEEPWSDEIERLVKHWRDYSIVMADQHENAGYKIKFNHNILGLPPIIIPITMTFISQILPTNNNSTNVFQGLMFLISGCTSALYKWLNLGERYSRHFSYSSRYNDITTAIDGELSRRRKFRRPADAFITEIRVKLDNLNHSAPEFPTCLCWKKKYNDEELQHASLYVRDST